MLKISMGQRICVRHICGQIVKPEHTMRQAGLNDFSAEILAVFGYQMIGNSNGRTASLKGLASKLTQLYKVFVIEPKLWTKFKEMIGIPEGTSLLALPKMFKQKLEEYLEKGKKWWDSVKAKMQKNSTVMRFIFLYASNAPTFSSLIDKVVEKLAPSDDKEMKSFLSKMLGGVRSFKAFLQDFFDRHPLLNALTTPAKAYIYWYIWTNVTEVSWKITDLLKGFLGLLSWSELLESLPESGFGFLISMLFPGIPGGWVAQSLSIGWNALLIPAAGLQLYYMYKKGLITADGKEIKA